MSKNRSSAARANQSLTGMLAINKKTADTEPNSSDDDSEINDHDHDYQPQIVGQTATHFLVSYVNPNGEAGHQWTQRNDFDEALVEDWQAVRDYVRPHAVQRAIEDGLWYIEIGEMIFVVEDSLYDLILSAIPMSHSEEFQKQVWARYGGDAARMVVGHDDSHYLVLSRVPGHELEAFWVEKEDVRQESKDEYWIWFHAITAARKCSDGDEEDFRPDLLMLEEGDFFVAMSMKVASEPVVGVIRVRHPGLFGDAHDEI